MQPPSLHSNFFSSLKRVEKRLKSEHPSQPSNPPPPPPPPPPPQLQQSLPPIESTNYASTESLSSPMFLHFDQHLPNHSSSLQEISDHETPHAFFSSSPPFPPIHQSPPPATPLDHPKPTNEAQDDPVDDIEKLIQILGLSDCEGEYQEQGGQEKKRDGCGGGLCECEDGFYAKIVGVKGPKCGKEVERLDGWIKHFLDGGGEEGKSEPLRLAHLLLGKAAFVLEGDVGGFGCLEFPSTVQEFLHNDPPK